MLREAAAEEAAKRRLELLGWYHQHRLLGLALTDLDVELHQENFPHPWQCALVFVSGDSKPTGAFIQPWDGQPYFKRAIVSFQELTDESAPSGDRALTCVDWSNYRPSRAVRLEPMATEPWRPAPRRPSHGGEELAAASDPAAAGASDSEVPVTVARSGDETAAEEVTAGDAPGAAEDGASAAEPLVPPTSLNSFAADPRPAWPPVEDRERPSPGADSKSVERPDESPALAASPDPPGLLHSWQRFMAERKAPHPPAEPRQPAPAHQPEPRRSEPPSGRNAPEAPIERSGGPAQLSGPGYAVKDLFLIIPQEPTVGLRDRFRSWIRRRQPPG